MNWNFAPRILIQGIDQDCAQEYLKQSSEHKHNIIAGITEENFTFTVEDIPVFNLVTDAIAFQGEITTSLIFNHPYSVLNAVYEAISAGIKQIVIYSEFIPPLDLFKIYQKAKIKDAKILGVSQGGILIPHQYYCGINYGNLYREGNIAMINYAEQMIALEISQHLQKFDLGFSYVINVGNSLLSEIDWDLWLNIAENDEKTEFILINLADISCQETEKLASSIANISKPIITYLLDKNNLKFKIKNHRAKVISDQIFNNLYQVNSYDLIREYFSKSKVIIAEEYQDIIKLLKSAKVTN